MTAGKMDEPLRSGRIDMANGKLRRVLRQRKMALYASAGIAVAAVAALTILPSGASVTPDSIPASAIPALRTNMLRLAQHSGDARPASIRAVFTTQDKALRTATPGDTVPGSASRAVYLVVMTGNFKVDAPVPYGARLPTGRYLIVTINPSTFQVMDLGVGNRRPAVSLRTYGQVSDLTNQHG
jgi:hypothetical protein